ncbi:hypothetical protein GCM10010976_12990 [Bizionia arctica]|uniref:Uncharacterized protein n=2 Tax=Bizionia arctica TaxID=1495645 RepID=A0A917GF39_9FLAO|nr:hypothetical protein GCM10010976_12990 [Bizionia arctica]
MLDNVLHAVGLFFLFNFIIGENRLRKKLLVTERVSNQTIANENETGYILTRQ